MIKYDCKHLGRSRASATGEDREWSQSKEAAGSLQFSRPCAQDNWDPNSGNGGLRTEHCHKRTAGKGRLAISYCPFRQKLYIQILTNEVFTANWGGQTGALVRLQTPWWVISLWTAPQSFKRQLYHTTVTITMDMSTTGHWPVQCWTAKHTLKSQWMPARNLSAQESGGNLYTATLIREGGAAQLPKRWRGTSQHNLMGYKKDSCTNFCGLSPLHCFGKVWGGQCIFFFNLNCVCPFSNRECVYSQKYTANINNNYTFVLRTTTTKESRAGGEEYAGKLSKICRLLTICFPRMFA